MNAQAYKIIWADSWYQKKEKKIIWETPHMTLSTIPDVTPPHLKYIRIGHLRLQMGATLTLSPDHLLWNLLRKNATAKSLHLFLEKALVFPAHGAQILQLPQAHSLSSVPWVVVLLLATCRAPHICGSQLCSQCNLFKFCGLFELFPSFI